MLKHEILTLEILQKMSCKNKIYPIYVLILYQFTHFYVESGNIKKFKLSKLIMEIEKDEHDYEH